MPNTLTVPASAILFRGEAAKVAVIGLDNRVALKKVQIARDLGTEIEVTGGLARTSASSPIRPIRSAKARRFRSWKPLGIRRRPRPRCNARKGRAIPRRPPTRWRKHGGNTESEVVAVAGGADRACARRL